MGKVIVSQNPFDLTQYTAYEFKGLFIDFLQDHFPNGFDGPHLTAINTRKLAVKDYDREICDGDLVVIAISPTVETIITVLVGAVISMALNYAINAFFGTEGSKTSQPASYAGLPSASSTYTLNTPTNVSRLGDPIPVAYGKNLIVPDIASQPWSFFYENDMYVCMLLCLGHGYFDIHSLQVANSLVSSFQPGVFNYVVFEPHVHESRFGVIEYTTGIWENVYTSPEVSDQELLADRGGSYHGTIAMWNGTWQTYSGGIFYLNPPALEYIASIGKQPVYMIVTNSAGNDGVYEMGYIIGAGGTEPDTTPDYGAKGHLLIGVNWPTAGTITGDVEISLVHPTENVGATYIGPFQSSSVGMQTEYMQYDINFPSGCYGVDINGTISAFYVGIYFYAEPIDDNGDPTGGATQTVYWEEWFTTNTAQRRTIHHAVPWGRYRVTAFRATPKSDQAAEQSDVYWVGLKAILQHRIGTPVYSDTTMIAVSIKATNGLSADATNRIAVNCTRKINGVPNRNPITAFKDIFTNTTYGGARPTIEIDAYVNTLETTWASRLFDAVFDTKSTVWEALKLSIQMQHAAPTMNGSVVTIVEDKDHTLPTAELTENNIVDLSLSYVFSQSTDPDGVEGEYRDPDDNAALYAIYPDTSVNPESIVLWGCRDYATALAYVTQRWKQLSLRRKIITLTTELDAHVLVVGDPVNVTHRLINDGVPTLCVIRSITPQDEFKISVELHVHVPEVFA